MKNVRSVALNWALLALVVMAIIYGITSLSGGMPPVTVGGYSVPINEMDLTMPLISGLFWLLIVPLLVFTGRYFWGLVVFDLGLPKKNDVVPGLAAGILGGVFWAVILGIVMTIDERTIGAIGTATILGLLFGVILGELVNLSVPILGKFLGVGFSMTFGTMLFLIFALFLTPYKIEFLLALPGIAIVLLVVTASLISVPSLLFALIERFPWAIIRAVATGDDSQLAPEKGVAMTEETGEELTIVQEDGLEFHARSDGTPAYEQRFDHVGNFREGLAWVVKAGKWFHIRPDGTPAYEERYDNVGDFCDGLAWARDDDESFHIHPDGTLAYEERYNSVSSFIDGLARVRTGEESFQIRPDGTRVAE